jgi:serine/threonine protein kinase
MFAFVRFQRWLLIYGIIISALICTTSSINYDGQKQQQDVNSPTDARKSFLLLCLTDGTIVSLDAWTGIHQSVIRAEPLLQTHYNHDGSQHNDASSVMILPGLDGRLYYKPPSPTFEGTSSTISEAPPLQELPISMAALLENPVRSCQPVTLGASSAESTDVSCGILTAQADVSLLALSARTGTIKWQNGNGLRSTRHPHDENGPVLLLQRKDHCIQFVRTNDGQQMWNVSLGAYQALDFDLPTQKSDIRRHTKDGYMNSDIKEQYPMMIDDDDDETNNVDDIQPQSSSFSQQENSLPAILFQDSGQTIMAINPLDGGVLWRQDVPSTLASVFGIANGQWQTIPITTSPSFDDSDSEGTKRVLRTDVSHLSIAQQMEHHRAIDLIEYERFLWEQRWSMLSSNSLSKPYTQLPKELPGRVDAERHTFDTDLCWIEDESQWGTCPTNEDVLGFDFLHLPSPPPKAVVVLADGLLLSWTLVMISVIVYLVFVLVIVRFWYLRKKSQWIEMLADASQRTQKFDATGDIADATKEEKEGNSPVMLLSLHSLHSSDRTRNNDLSNMDGVPVVRYSRYASEFQELHSLGKGGFGSVFQCQNTLDGRQYAVKKVSILSNSHDFQQQLHRVLREVKILAILDHPNIVRYYTAWLEIEELERNQQDGVASMSDPLGERTRSTLSRRRSFSSSILLQGTNDFLPVQSNNNPLGWSNGLDISDSSSLVLPKHGSIRATNGLDDDFLIFEGSQEGETRSLSGTGFQRGNDACVSRGPCGECAGTELDCSERSFSLAPVFGQNPTGDNDDDVSDVAVVVRRTLYIQMQLCSQTTLAEFLADRKTRCESTESFKVNIPKALRIFLQIAEATAYVHACGLIHRDLKPNNCFMDETCSMVKVGDFGLSRESNVEEVSDSNDSDVSEHGTHEDHTAGVGTRSYASPEQLHGSDYDCSTDVYSLGIILFELLYPMYTGMERQVCFGKLRDHIFPSDWDTAVGIAFPTVKPLVIDMLSRNPSKRPSAESTARYIQSILGEFTLVSLDLHHFESPDIVLLRVEAEHRDDVLQHTMQLIREEYSAATNDVADIVQYGMRSSRASDDDKATAIMEFAIRHKYGSDTLNVSDCISDLVRNLSKRPDVLKVRQVSNNSSFAY